MIIVFENLDIVDYLDQDLFGSEDEELNCEYLERNDGFLEISQPEAKSDSERIRKTGPDSDSEEASAAENDVEFDAEDIRDLEQQLAEICQPCNDHETECEKKLPKVSLEILQQWFPEYEPEKTLRVSKLSPVKHSYLRDSLKRIRKKSKLKNTAAVGISCYEEPRSPEPAEIEDSTLGSVVPDLEGLHDIDRQAPCRLWYDKMDLPQCAKIFSYSWLKEPDQDDLDKVGKAVDDMLRSFSHDFTKKRARDDDCDVGRLPHPKRLKIISERNELSDVVFNSNGQKSIVVAELMDQLSKDDRREMPDGRYLLVELKQNGYAIQIGENDSGLSLEPPPDQSHQCDHYKYFNAKLYRGDWINDVVWDHEDLIKSGRPKPVTIDETLFSYVKEREEAVKESKAHKSNLAEHDTHYRPDLELCFATELAFCHSTPVEELSQVIFPPIFSNELDLRIFHRPRLSIRGECELEKVFPLGPHMEFANKQRKIEESKGEYQHMKKIRDLTGKDGDLILLEFCEDYPPFMNQLGMASEICNYYLEDNTVKHPHPKFGKNVAASKSDRLFFGNLSQNQCLNAVENRMYRAPIFEHVMKRTDFLIIYSNESFYIRTVDALFAVGQQCPLMEVPKPYCKLAHNILRDYIDLFICRLFWKSKDNPKSLKMEDLRRAFPSQSEVYLRRRLSQWSEFHRVGNENKWVIKRGTKLPDERDMNLDLTPELYCAYKSMRSAELRLKDEGYHIKENEEGADEEAFVEENETEDALKAAPWSTTNAYMMAMDKKCLLDAYTSIDPTDCGVGYAYIKVPCKPAAKKDASSDANKSRLYNTDADFRRLKEVDSVKILQGFGVPMEEIQKMARFEKINKIREISNEKDNLGVANLKFARHATSVLSNHKKKYIDNCQHAFDMQNRFLASYDDSSDESMDEKELEMISKSLEGELLVLYGDTSNSKKNNLPKQLPKPVKKISKLTITRTFNDHMGRPIKREEVVTNPELIRRYLKEKDKETEKNKRLAPKKGTNRPPTKTTDFRPKKQQIDSHLTQADKEKIKREKKRERDRARYKRLKEERMLNKSVQA